ncbi:MAG TPA: hypothetical protein VFR31_17230 [Thermoanaerobaculia bacterium]|nr:hypothetical protein [Thermoanaerobaculia bacterium]
MSPQTGRIRLDLNNPVFQRNLFELSKEDQRRVLTTLDRLSRISWDQVYRDSGLNWEAILSREGERGERLYSLRMGKALRAVAFREGDWLRFVSLHPDHDSAYG